MNVICFVPGCTNPVVAQCTCGKFFCHEHSKHELCLKCGAQLEIEQLHARYLELAKSVGSRLRRGTPFFLTPDFWIRITLRGKEKKVVAEIERDNPEFGSFYQAWKSNNIKQFWTSLGVTVGEGLLDSASGVNPNYRRILREESDRHK